MSGVASSPPGWRAAGQDPPWRELTVCVAGLGISGTAAAEVLLRLGATVHVLDRRDGGREQATAAALGALGATVLIGERVAATLPPGTDLVVTSPGWRPDSVLLAAAAAAGVPVWGEVELAWRLRRPDDAPWLAVTGTNGKTTTVRLLTAMLRAAGRHAAAVGNVGAPVVAAVCAAPAAYDVLAVELSSFQLHWSSSLSPCAAAVLNVAPDHLDWHGSWAAYLTAKGSIYRGARVAVFNADDACSLRLAAASEHRVGFTLGPPPPGHLGVVDGMLVDRAFGDAELAAVAEVQPAGVHNVANALAAAALARAYGVPAGAVRDGLRSFVPDPHRNTVVGTVHGVAYVDDSKATNPHAATASLAAYDRVVWVAGGLLKGADVDELLRTQAGRLRAVVLLGRDRAQIAAALARHAPDVPVIDVPDTDTGAMISVVRQAARVAQPGDTVLLAPAAASMDIFADYAARGDAFAAAVRRLGGREQA